MAKTKKTIKTKIFILDTNVILHNYKAIFTFEDNDIFIPITVLEEIDSFKKGNNEINFHAREFTRELDKIVENKSFYEGVELGEGLGKLYIITGKPFSETLSESFSEITPDHKILAICEYVKNKFKDRKVVLVSKDINLRMKAKSLGINAEDYKADTVKNVSELNKNIITIENFSSDIINKIYENKGGIDAEDFNLNQELKGHRYFILKNGSKSVLAHYNPITKKITHVNKRHTFGIEPRNAEQTFALDALMDKDVQLVSLMGKAGTGKTLLALAAALAQNEDFEQILLARPIVPLSNRDLGFLPGDIKDKIGPYMQPLFDNLNVIKHQFKAQSSEFMKIEEMLTNEKLIISPLAYIRGRSLSKVFFIIDEAQNLTPLEVKTIITRAGEGTKIVFTGDIQQIDSPYLDSKSNGLSVLSHKMRGQDVFALINLVKGERSYLAELASDIL